MSCIRHATSYIALQLITAQETCLLTFFSSTSTLRQQTFHLNAMSHEIHVFIYKYCYYILLFKNIQQPTTTKTTRRMNEQIDLSV